MHQIVDLKNHSVSASMSNVRLGFLQHCIKDIRGILWELNHVFLWIELKLVPQYHFLWIKVHPGTNVVIEIAVENIPLEGDLCPTNDISAPVLLQGNRNSKA